MGVNPGRPEDGRLYHIGDKVTFTDDTGKQVLGIVHGVRYQEGRYELVGAHYQDNHKDPGPDNLPVPGTGEMQLVKGTEQERHSFEYVIVHEHEHKAWHETEKNNQKHIKNGDHHLVQQHPPLTQHIRIYEAD